MRNRARTRKRPNERRRCAIGLASDARADPDRPGGVCRGSAKSVGGGLMSGVVGVLARVRRGPAGTMGSA